MLATKRTWVDPEGSRWKISTEYAGQGSPSAFDSPFLFTWIGEEADPRSFSTPAPMTFDLHELSDTDLRCLWSRFGR